MNGICRGVRCRLTTNNDITSRLGIEWRKRLTC